jgi:hypothetical protein
VLGMDLIVFSPDFTVHEVIFSSAQFIEIEFVGFLQFTVIDSAPLNVNFLRSGSNVRA